MKSSLSDAYRTLHKILVQIIGQVLSNLRFKFFKIYFKFSIKAKHTIFLFQNIFSST